VSEKVPKTLAEVVESRDSVVGHDEPVLGATAITYGEPSAGSTLTRKPVPLVLAETALDR